MSDSNGDRAPGFFKDHPGHTHAMDVSTGYCVVCGNRMKPSLDERLTALERSHLEVKSSLETISKLLETMASDEK